MLRKEEILERTNNGLNVFKHSPVNGVSGVISLILYMNEMCLWGVLQAIKGLILMKIGTMF
jgi:hypothetical protein